MPEQEQGGGGPSRADDTSTHQVRLTQDSWGGPGNAGNAGQFKGQGGDPLPTF
jgi:hypothetical protein